LGVPLQSTYRRQAEMHLSKTVKIFVGIATLFVFLIPLLLILFWLYTAFSMATAASLPSSEFPPDRFPFNIESMRYFIVTVACLINMLGFALVGFYVFHAIKSNNISDVIRTIAILIIIMIPYLGMPLYYIMFILLPKPPNWTIKKELTLTS
jgi:hypothetical protein